MLSHLQVPRGTYQVPAGYPDPFCHARPHITTAGNFQVPQGTYTPKYLPGPTFGTRSKLPAGSLQGPSRYLRDRERVPVQPALLLRVEVVEKVHKVLHHTLCQYRTPHSAIRYVSTGHRIAST
eukprot:3941578-Rhodomonas_salina.3